MPIKDILNAEHTLHGVQCSSKKRVLEKIAQQLSELNPKLNAKELFDAFIERERLGSTGIGEGVALPHCRMNLCTQTMGLLVHLKKGVDFDALDGKDVDLVFALVVPQKSTQEHLNTLSEIAEAFYKAEFREALRNTRNAEELYLKATQAGISELQPQNYARK